MGYDLEFVLSSYESGRLDEYEDVFTRYLPLEEPVLEAGCGMGQIVAALAKRGYSVEGVDFAEKTVERIHSLRPALKVRVGDVNRLEVQDGAYGGYISLGVLEHDSEGPLRGLREACRVLSPGGVALIAIPHLNRKRLRMSRTVPAVNRTELPGGLRFYQYYFGPLEFESLLHEAGLDVLETFGYGVYSGLTRDYGIGAWLDRHRFFSWRVKGLIQSYCIRAGLKMRHVCGHMMMYVCRKPAAGIVCRREP